MSKIAQNHVQSMVLTGLSTIVGVLFLTVAGKVVDKIGQAIIADAQASVAAEVLVAQTTKDLVPVSNENASIIQSASSVELPQWLDMDVRSTEWDLDFMNEGRSNKYAKGPRLHSKSAFVVDLDSGEVLWSKAPDTRRVAASITKVLASLTLAEKDVDLDDVVCTDHRIRTGMAGAGTRVSIGDCSSGWDFMGAALVSSDNGAAFSYPLLADEEMTHFADSMNQMAIDLGMTQSDFVDSAGIYDDNISTARDLTRASIVAAFHPEVSIASGAKSWYAKIGDDVEHYTTTNKAAGRTNFLLAKTGFTYTARANFTGVYQEKDGRRIAFTILGAWSPSRRSKDVNKIIDWVRQHP